MNAHESLLLDVGNLFGVLGLIISLFLLATGIALIARGITDILNK